jgi:hypothetical protein
MSIVSAPYSRSRSFETSADATGWMTLTASSKLCAALAIVSVALPRMTGPELPKFWVSIATCPLSLEGEFDKTSHFTPVSWPSHDLVAS